MDAEAPLRAWIAAPELGAGLYRRFERPTGAAVARAPDEVRAVLEAAEDAARRGRWAVGWVGYEAAPGLDRKLVVRADGGGAPLAAFAFFEDPDVAPLEPPAGTARAAGIAPDWSAGRHRDAVAAVREAIARGETYQVNLTFPMRGRLEGEPVDLFRTLAPAAAAPFAAYLEDERRAIVSLSPELFFELDGESVAMRPMKGTRERGRIVAEDEAARGALERSEKDRAENLMIVDMARNDLGKVARAGTVAVADLFRLERYPTVWQATSTVRAESDAPLAALFGALFPCCSVTGAPKVSTMEWIARLESAPRGVYCGALGWVAPGRRARFSVAIRTAVVERATGRLDYGIGGGIVWDSDPGEEWRECLVKARALADPGGPLGLFETIFWRGAGGGAPLAPRHCARLSASAALLDLDCPDPAGLAEVLRRAVAPLPPGPHRLRLELAPDGTVAAAAEPFCRAARAWHLRIAGLPVDPEDRRLFHKTTRRERYDAALAEARARGADEALLENRDGELTEGSRTNLVIERGGKRVTPSWDAGLLPGILRGRLLEGGRLEEARLRRADLRGATRIWAINALRGATRVLAIDDRDGTRLWERPRS